MLKQSYALLMAGALSSSSLFATFTIDLNFDLGINPYEDAADTVLSAANQAIFADAKTFWEDAITGYQDGVNRTVTIHASAFSQAAAGGGILLGSAGPRNLTVITATGPNILTVSDGAARFNVHPDAVGGAGLLNAATIRHEMGHILGIGTLWDTSGIGGGAFKSVYSNNTGMYTGANALAAYNEEFGQAAAFIPIELDGGPGTANGHWNERLDNFGTENAPGADAHPGDGVDAPTVVGGINAGKSLDDELMTGVLSGDAYLSNTTLGSLQDIGFTTKAFTAIPEPSSLLLLGFGSGLMVFRRSRKRA